MLLPVKLDGHVFVVSSCYWKHMDSFKLKTCSENTVCGIVSCETTSEAMPNQTYRKAYRNSDGEARKGTNLGP